MVALFIQIKFWERIQPLLAHPNHGPVVFEYFRREVQRAPKQPNGQFGSVCVDGYMFRDLDNFLGVLNAIKNDKLIRISADGAEVFKSTT